MQFSAMVFAAIGIAGSVTALDINCKGNGNCASQGDDALTEVHNKILALGQGSTFSNGQHIACAGGTGQACAFYQNLVGTQTAAQAAQHVANLLDHGCKTCGSDPTDGSNVSNGELTVNWVS
ncbi:MAG: hypothetical protein ALECFALPRED_004512 [Alectoria fallacina]|uniref:Killer toxin Kp4 domain-containing protein n=1 Tax=Alectoria fallacina TaxID=1903189 RepID=A0A8H3IWS2_9LECA|nr:MAG: hypothetical protein ALECFALPRED_004512 [Alectoria fallacina]